MYRFIISSVLLIAAGAVSAEEFATKKTSGDVSFALTPRTTAERELIVEVRADTHSGDLADLDLARLISLETGGSVYRPVAATRLGGHHGQASVTFEVGPDVARFALTIGAVRGMAEQRLEWP
jgi:hypothetical protein